MSDAASVPFSETKAPEAPDRLHRGALGLVDISASTMANVGPAYSFYFGIGFLVLTAGVAAPLTIVVAGIAIALLGSTLAQFSRAQPSTGGFITFVGKTFGGTSAVTTALLCGAGYIIAISSVLAICGGFLSITLNYYFKWNVPWGILSVILVGLCVLMMIRGVGVSTRLAGLFFGFEMLVLLVVSVAALIKNGGHLSFVPFEPSHITKGFGGLAAGFPLAIYLFIGWENSAAGHQHRAGQPVRPSGRLHAVPRGRAGAAGRPGLAAGRPGRVRRQPPVGDPVRPGAALPGRRLRQPAPGRRGPARVHGRRPGHRRRRHRAVAHVRPDALPPARGLAGDAGGPLRLHAQADRLLRPQPDPGRAPAGHALLRGVIIVNVAAGSLLPLPAGQRRSGRAAGGRRELGPAVLASNVGVRSLSP
jgi:hypothetical protein